MTFQLEYIDHMTIDSGSEKVETLCWALEQKRIKRVRGFFVGVIASIGLAMVYFDQYPGRDHGILIAVFGCLASYAPLFFLQREFKDELVPEFLQQYGFSYDRKASSVRLERYFDILPVMGGQRVSDLFWGERNGIAMSFMELHSTKVSGKGKNTGLTSLFCCIKHRKKTTVPTLVCERDNGVLAGLASNIVLGGRSVRLEDPEFQKRFAVYSRDQVEARYLLTPTMMNRLMSLQRRYKGVRMLFRDGEALILLPGFPNMFEMGTVFWPVGLPDMMRFHEELQHVFELIDALKLDAETKI